MPVAVRISFERFAIDMQATQTACYSLAAGVVQTANNFRKPCYHLDSGAFFFLHGILHGIIFAWYNAWYFARFVNSQVAV